VPIFREGELDILSHSADQTERLGMRLGALLQAGDVICLSGDMGAGKTVFSVGIGKGWGALTPLTSPTFNIVHEHQYRSGRHPGRHWASDSGMAGEYRACLAPTAVVD
jgi:tRNA threonylcarbamoyladenosine biosynthesis protein TsaE